MKFVLMCLAGLFLFFVSLVVLSQVSAIAFEDGQPKAAKRNLIIGCGLFGVASWLMIHGCIGELK